MWVPAAASAALVASWLAQAEPAPPEPSPPEPAANPAPAAPSEVTPRRPLHAVAVHGRFAYRPNDSGSGVPSEGFSLGGPLGLGVGLDFFFDRFAGDQKNVTSGTQVALYAHELMQTSFVALQTAA